MRKKCRVAPRFEPVGEDRRAVLSLGSSHSRYPLIARRSHDEIDRELAKCLDRREIYELAVQNECSDLQPPVPPLTL